MNSWFILIAAGVLEICWASSLKATVGFTRLWPSLFFVAALAGSMFLLSIATKQLPVGTAYAVWVGVGAAGTVLVGVFFLGETMSLTRGIFLSLLIISIAGLKFSTASN